MYSYGDYCKENYRPAGRQSKPVFSDYKSIISDVSTNTLQLAIPGIPVYIWIGRLI
jgi:hypothetical protein